MLSVLGDQGIIEQHRAESLKDGFIHDSFDPERWKQVMLVAKCQICG